MALPCLGREGGREVVQTASWSEGLKPGLEMNSAAGEATAKEVVPLG